MTRAEKRPRVRTEERCTCGNLVAVRCEEGVEILCRRCKRIHRIPWMKEAQAKEAGAL